MRARTFALVLAASAPPLYAAYVYGWKLAEFLSFAIRLDENLPLTTWGQVVLTVMQVVVIGGGLAVAWQAAPAKRWRVVAVAMAVAWLASAPLYALILLAPL
jgi:hypothetical protein